MLHWTDEYTAAELDEMEAYYALEDRERALDAADPRTDGVPDLSTFHRCTCEYDAGNWFPCARHMTPHSAHQPWDRAPGCRACEDAGYTYLEALDA